MACKVDSTSYRKFDPHQEPSRLTEEWKKWFRGFEYFSKAKGITDPDQLCCCLLNEAGAEVQDEYDTLTHKPGDDEYEIVTKTLKKHFSRAKTNKRYERYVFRNIKQDKNSIEHYISKNSIEHYISKLRQQAALCQFSDVDDVMIDQIIEFCDEKFRTILL